MNNLFINHLLKTVLLLLLICPLYSYAEDKDHDGIDDKEDKCPNTAQLKKVSPDFRYAITVNPERLKSGAHAVPVNKDGCEPDSDGDGIKDSLDYCPEDNAESLSKGVAANGCPIHSDKDGTPDYRDRCPDTPKGVKTDRFGCPAA